jgi:hypothetical protein
MSLSQLIAAAKNASLKNTGETDINLLDAAKVLADAIRDLLRYVAMVIWHSNVLALLRIWLIIQLTLKQLKDTKLRKKRFLRLLCCCRAVAR